MTPSLQQLIMGVYALMGRVPYVLIGFAVVYFFVKLVQIMRSQSGKERQQLKALLAYGILTLFVMMFLWGIIKLFQSSLFPGGFIQRLGK